MFKPMKMKLFMYVPLALILGACGGNTETAETTETPNDSANVEIQYAPLKTSEEVAAETVYKSLADFNAVEDKATVIRYVSGEYNLPFPTELLDAHNLQVLALTNMTGELPEEIGTFKNLTTLVISGEMTKLPESVSELQNLKAVSFEYCKSLDINQALEVLKKCPNIQHLNLSGMGLTE